MTHIAVTGATGFVGGAVLEEALRRGHRVTALTRRAQKTRKGVRWVRGALDDAKSLSRLVMAADAVLHVAGVVNAPTREGFAAGNIEGTKATLAAARAEGIRRFVHVSSLAAREPKLSHYGWSKRQAEAAVIVSGTDWTIVRPPAIFGPGDREMLELFRMAKRGFVMLPPAGMLSVIAVEDLARLLVDLAEQPHAGIGDIYEVDDGRPGGWTHQAFGEAIGQAVGRKARTIATPKPLLSLTASLDRMIRGDKAKLTADRVAYFTHPDWVIDPARRPLVTLWRPRIDTAVGLKATADWYRKEGLL